MAAAVTGPVKVRVARYLRDSGVFTSLPKWDKSWSLLSCGTESLAYIYIRNHWLDIATTSDIKLKFDIICLSNTCLSVTCLDKFANKGFLTVGTLEVILVCFMDFLHVSLFA